MGLTSSRVTMGLSRRVTVGLFSATSPKPHYFSLPFQIQVKWEILRKTRVSGDSNTVAISLTICQCLWFVVGSEFSWTHKSPELIGQIYLQKQGKASAGCPSWGSVGGRKQGPGPNVTTTTPRFVDYVLCASDKKKLIGGIWFFVIYSLNRISMQKYWLDK